MERVEPKLVDHINPRHYKRGGIETIDYIRAVCRDLPGDEAVYVGNIIKYVSRYQAKNPQDPSQDLKKAEWYLNELLKVLFEKKELSA
jgi:hypothetical protein